MCVSLIIPFSIVWIKGLGDTACFVETLGAFERIDHLPEKKHTDRIRTTINCSGIDTGIIHVNNLF